MADHADGRQRHIGKFMTRLGIRRRDQRLERHAADQATARRVPADFRMPRTGPDRPLRCGCRYRRNVVMLMAIKSRSVAMMGVIALGGSVLT